MLLSVRTKITNWMRRTNQAASLAKAARWLFLEKFHLSGSRITRLERSGRTTGSQYWNLKWVKKKTVTLSGRNQAKIKLCRRRCGPRQAPQTAAPRAITKESAPPKDWRANGQEAVRPLAYVTP